MTAATGYWPCRRCGMTFLLSPPEPENHLLPRFQERLVCSECGLAYGVSLPRRSVVCWLIREGGARNMMGVKKIA